MHLYLKSGENERWLTVQLADGNTPRIAGLSDGNTCSVTDDFEPALWFKATVLESMTIDCDKRVACWRNLTVDKQNGEPITHWLSAEDSFYDWDDDIDQLFNLANVLIQENPLSEPIEVKRKEKIISYEQNLFKMLHCYIFPKIKLYPVDLDSVHASLKAQNKALSQLEDLTLMHSRLAEHYMNQMRTIRQDIIFPMLEELLAAGQVSKELCEILSYDIKKVEPTLRDEVNQAQSKVNSLKESLSKGAGSSKIADDLNEARSVRDQAHQSLANLLIGKALVQSSLDVAQHVHDIKVGLNESCQQYTRLYSRVCDEKAIVKQTLDKKLRALGVRECINSVIKDLNEDSPSFGEDPEINETQPEWQTLNERVTSIIRNTQHPIGIKCKSFCQELQLQYQRKMRTTENVVYGSSRFMTSYNEFYVISEQDLGLNNMYLEDQRNVIMSHLYLIAELLAEQFSNRYQMFVRKARLCYEKCFFNRIGRDLILIYRVVHGKVMQTIERRIKALREISVCKLGLQMRDEWWLELFEPNENSNNDGAETNSFKYSDTDSISSDTDRDRDRDQYQDDISYEGDFGDDESQSDISEEDFCSDEESGKTKIPNFTSRPCKGTDHWQIKHNLLKSKDKVVSRSLPNVTGTNKTMIKASTDLLQERFIKTATESSGHMDTEMIGRYLAPESDDDILSVSDIRMERRTQSVSTIGSRNDDNDQEDPSKDIKSPSNACPAINRRQSLRHAGDSFNKHFSEALKQIKNIFTNSSPLKKMQCLTNSLRTVSHKIEELRLRAYYVEEEEDGENISNDNARTKQTVLVDRSKVAVTAEDLLPLLVLLLLKMEPHDVAKLYAELLFISDLMADFLSSGCHSYALCEFHIAYRVLDQTCDELEL